jgi:hypothetical protein
MGSNFTCAVCGAEFDLAEGYALHMSGHQTPSIYTCEVCGETFTSHNAFVFHQTVHSNWTPAFNVGDFVTYNGASYRVARVDVIGRRYTLLQWANANERGRILVDGITLDDMNARTAHA